MPQATMISSEGITNDCDKEKGMEKVSKDIVKDEILVPSPGVAPRPSQMFRIHHQMPSGTNTDMTDCRQEKPSFFLTVSLLDTILAENVNESNAEQEGVDFDEVSGTDDDMPTLLDRDPSFSSEDDMPPLTDRYSYSTDEEL